MKPKKLLFALCAFCFFMIQAQNEFITVWQPSFQTTSNSTATQIAIPAEGSGYTVSWSEVGFPAHSGVLTNQSSLISNPLVVEFGTPLNPNPTDATYEVKISGGTFNRICFGNLIYPCCPYGLTFGDRYRIIQIKQWGNIPWNTMYGAFESCWNLKITATDAPDLSLVTNMGNMFASSKWLVSNSSINTWNTSNVTNMNGTFWGCEKFNTNINSWNTSAVTNMSNMFRDAKLYNQPMNNWNTANVTMMERMFYRAEVFNNDISTWNTGNVTNMLEIFKEATLFNQNINSWNVSKVTTFSQAFAYCYSFNQPLNNWQLNTQNVIDMHWMFLGCQIFNQPLSNWNTSKVTDMYGMFAGCPQFNQNLNSWNVSYVNNMQNMFRDATSFNQPVNNWNTSSLLLASSMFENATSFNQPIGNIVLMNTTGLNFNALENILRNSALSCENYDATLIQWANNANAPNTLNLGYLSPLKYSSAAAVSARNTLIAPVASGGKNWYISGDTYDASCYVSLGVNEFRAHNESKIYPNPAKEFIHVDLENAETVTILDFSGKMAKKIAGKKGQNTINIAELSTGNYLLKTGNTTLKFIKK